MSKWKRPALGQDRVIFTTAAGNISVTWRRVEHCQTTVFVSDEDSGNVVVFCSWRDLLDYYGAEDDKDEGE